MGLKSPTRKSRRTKTLLVDGNVLMKRSYNGAKNVYHKDKHIGGIFAFYSTLRKLVVEHKIDKIVITWDGERGGTLRLDYYPDYKGNSPRFFDQEYGAMLQIHRPHIIIITQQKTDHLRIKR